MQLGDPALLTQKDSLLVMNSSFETGRFLSMTKRVTRTKVFMLMLEALQRKGDALPAAL